VKLRTELPRDDARLVARQVDNALGHPRAALLGFAVAVLAYNVLALLQRCIELAHLATHPALQVSLYHLALQVRGGYEGMLIALPDAPWISGSPDPATVAAHLLRLARNVVPRRVAASPRKPKPAAKKGYVDGKTARTHVSTARVLAQANISTP
jgi:hypothetical protein